MRSHHLVVSLFLLASACYKWANSDRALSDVLPAERRRPERIRVTLRTGEVVDLWTPRLSADTIRGFNTPLGVEGVEHSVPVADVTKVEIREVDPVKTSLAAVGIGVTILAVIAAATYEPPLSESSDCPHGSGRGPSCPISCPLVYSWDGTRWRLDSGTFGGAITRGLQRTDVDNLDHLVAVDGNLRLRVTNELQETDHIDALHLLAVDHPVGTNVVPDPAGELHVVRRLEAPFAARDFRGNDALDRVVHADGWGWESSLTPRDATRPDATRDGLVLRFARPRAADQAHLVLDGNNTPWATFLLGEWLAARGPGLASWYDSLDASSTYARKVGARIAEEAFLQVWLATSGGWTSSGLFWEAGPEISKRQVLHLDLRQVVGDTITVRLESVPAFWWIDRVALDATPDQPIRVETLHPRRAAAHDGRDPRDVMAAEDDRHLTLETGDWIELDFTAPYPNSDLERSYLLRSTGWYRVHIPARAMADRRALESVEQRGGLSRIATERLNEAIRGAGGGGR